LLFNTGILTNHFFQECSMLFPAIDPVAIWIGPFAVRWYALAYITGLLGGWLYARYLIQKAGLWGDVKRPSFNDMDDMILWVAFGIVLGGRLGYVFFYNFSVYAHNPMEILAVWRGGMSFHGGLAGAALAIALFARSRGVNVLAMLDIAAIVAPIGLFFGRIANFINSELWGRVAPDFPYAVIFPNGGPEPRHPSQLYEAFSEGLLLFIIMALTVRLYGFKRPGLASGVFVIGYGFARMVCELFRQPDPQLGFLFGGAFEAMGGITMGMVLSVPMVLIGLVTLFYALSGKTQSRSA
jgi:phosphatidylglycerol---prolipoprotein diacylglyceryl transferase